MNSDQLPLARYAVDRDGHARTRAGLVTEVLANPGTRVVTVRRGKVATSAGDEGLAFAAPPVEPGPGELLVYLGRDAEAAYLARLLPDPVPDAGQVARRTDDPQGPNGTEPRYAQLRDIGWRLAARDAGLASVALGLANWHATHTHCPRCGAPTEVVEAGWVRRCPRDGSLHYPRTDAAVIMAITDDADRLLLGHAPHWPEGQYSVPAGFVEPGESLEAAVRREVAEETNVVVGDVAYVASQPWPFPASLMLGFRGHATSTVVRPDGVEITHAAFFTRDELTRAWSDGSMRIPRPTSIARGLIEEWYGAPLPA